MSLFCCKVWDSQLQCELKICSEVLQKPHSSSLKWVYLHQWSRETYLEEAIVKPKKEPNSLESCYFGIFASPDSIWDHLSSDATRQKQLAWHIINTLHLHNSTTMAWDRFLFKPCHVSVQQGTASFPSKSAIKNLRNSFLLQWFEVFQQMRKKGNLPSRHTNIFILFFRCMSENKLDLSWAALSPESKWNSILYLFDVFWLSMTWVR